MTRRRPVIINISGEMVAAAQAEDVKWRPRRRPWRKVRDAQVARLLTGASELITAAEREKWASFAERWAANWRAQNQADPIGPVWTPESDALEAIALRMRQDDRSPSPEHCHPDRPG